MKKIIVLFFLLLAGCDNMDEERAVEKRKKEFSSGGFVIGSLPDGRKITRYEIENSDRANHWIYVVDHTASTTITYPSGKTKKTIVVIDGIEYVPNAEQFDK